MSKVKSLNTLVKIAKRELDSLRRDLARLESEKQKMQQAIERMQEELAREMELAASQPDMGAFFGDYAKRIRNRQDELRENMRKLDVVIDALRDKILLQFAEQKRYELARETHQINEKKRVQRQENIELEDIASVHHERKKVDG